MGIQLDGQQRFTCHQCGRCCRHGWDIPILPAEAEAYRAAHAERWYRERDDGPEGATSDPFEKARRDGSLLRLRKRPDGTCGFLSPAGRCRIHEELGERRKPLACRAFPFRFHPVMGRTLVVPSFSCPTVVRNQGADLPSQHKQIERLARDWQRAFPDIDHAPSFVAGTPIDADALALLRRASCAILDRSDGDLRTNLARLAAFLEGLCGPKVLRLTPDAFLELLSLMGRHAERSEKPPERRRPAWVSRLFFRGYLFASGAIRQRLEARHSRIGRARLWWRQVRLLLHVHSLAPALRGFNLGRARRTAFPPADGPVWSIAHAYCRGSLASLGTGRWPIMTEIGIAAATLRVAFVLAAQDAPDGEITEDALVRGLTEAADLHHLDAGLLGRLVGLLAGGLEPLCALAGDERLV